jgi:hypothetical protein
VHQRPLQWGQLPEALTLQRRYAEQGRVGVTAGQDCATTQLVNGYNQVSLVHLAHCAVVSVGVPHI